MALWWLRVAWDDFPASEGFKVQSMPLRLSHFVQGAHVAPLLGRWTKCANRIGMVQSSTFNVRCSAGLLAAIIIVIDSLTRFLPCSRALTMTQANESPVRGL